MRLKEKKVENFSDYLPYGGFVGDTEEGICITKNGFFLRTYRYALKDFSFAIESEIIEAFRGVGNFFKVLSSEGWAFYLDSFRGKIDASRKNIFEKNAPEAAKNFDVFHLAALGDFFASDHFITFCYNPYFGSRMTKLLFRSKNKTYSKSEFLAAFRIFREKTEDIKGTLSSVFSSIRALSNDESMTFFHRCVSPYFHPVKAPAEVPFYLDYYLSDSTFVPDSVTTLDGFYVHTLSIHDFPIETRSNMITTLMASNMNFHFSLRFVCIPKSEIGGKIKGIRRAHFQKRKGLGGIIAEAITKEGTALEDTEAIAHTEDSSEALSLLASDMLFGYLTTTIVVMDKNWETGKETIKNLKKIMNVHGYVGKEEGLNNPLAFLGTIHGNVKYNSRAPLISTDNVAHLFPLSEPWRGDVFNEHLGEISGVNDPHMLVRFGAGYFYLNLNVGDVGHTLVVGPTGAGKSIFLATIALQFYRYPRAKIIFFDKDASSKNVCKNVGGKFFDIGSENCEYLLNPFADVQNVSHQLWLSKYFGEFFKSKGMRVGPKEEAEIFSALESMGKAKVSIDELSFERFQAEVQEEDARAILDFFTLGGEYSRFFAPVKDDIANVPWVTFELGALMQMEESIVKFILGYLFQKVSYSFSGDPVLLIVDEAWIFLDNEFFAGMMREWLKTLRKKNVYVILATQEMSDVHTSISSTIANACMTKIFLPNNQARQSENQRLYFDLGLSDDDLDVLIDAQPKREYLYASPKGKQLFELCLDKKQLKILKEGS